MVDLKTQTVISLHFVLITFVQLRLKVMPLQFFSLHQKLPSPPGSSTSSSLFNGNTAPLSSSSSSSLLFDYNVIDNKQKRRRRTPNLPLHASEEKDSEFELDRDKAREALKQLDQQIQTLSKDEPAPPKQRISFLNLETPAAKEMVKDAPPEFSDSFFKYSAVSLLMLTMLYNMIFLTIIKPAIDGPVQEDFSFLTSTTNNTTIKEAPNPSGFQQSTPPTVLSEE